jgi:Skp family chaperone for outer membrane proteins
MKLGQKSMLVGVAALIITTTGLVNLWAQQGTRAQPVSAAVVDVEAVFQSLDEQAEIEASINDQITQIQQWRQGMENELKAIQGEMDILSPDSPEFDQLQEQANQKLVELQVKLQYEQRRVEAEKAIQLEGLYRKILDMVEQIAKEQGYDLVLFKDRTPRIRNANQQQLAALIQVRKLLYSRDGLDITDQVTQRLNNQYTNR